MTGRINFRMTRHRLPTSAFAATDRREGRAHPSSLCRDTGTTGREKEPTMITVSGLTRKYGDRTVVDHVSFEREPGTVTGFRGPNGAGKTTTMRMIPGLVRATAGTAQV